MDNFEVVFWGVMGSCPGASPAAGENIGMNTPCVEIRAGDEVLILDSGTGIIPLGNYLAELDGVYDIHLFTTHAHWDHVQGFPFFSPAYDPLQKITIYGHFREKFKIDEIFKGLMKTPYFPVPFSVLQADIQFKELSPVEVTLLPSGTKVLSIPSDHPGGNLIYRIEKGGKSVSYVTDLTHSHGFNDQLINFVKDTDLLIYDANFTNFEFIKPQYEGWGHSTWEKGVQLATNANAEKLVLFHHALHRSREELFEIEREAQRLFPDTWLAIEGKSVYL